MWKYYTRRLLLKSRAFVPGLRAQHLREAMVGPLGHWEAMRAYQLRALVDNGLLPTHRVLDLGCGPLQGGIAMIRYLEPSCYFGVDRNPKNLAEGYRQIADHDLIHKNPRLLHSEVFGKEHVAGLDFDFIWASQILYYFDAEQLKTLLTFIIDVLAPQGKFLGDILGRCDTELRSRSHLAWCQKVKSQSVDQIHELAKPFALQARSLGRIDAYGYPKSLSLCSNVLIEITHAKNPPACLRPDDST